MAGLWASDQGNPRVGECTLLRCAKGRVRVARIVHEQQFLLMQAFVLVGQACGEIPCVYSKDECADINQAFERVIALLANRLRPQVIVEVQRSSGMQ